MLVTRKQFGLGLAAGVFGPASVLNAQAQQAPEPAAAPGKSAREPYFYKNKTFEFIFQIALGRSFYMDGNPGKVLYLTRQIKDGDHEGAFQTLKQPATRLVGRVIQSAGIGA